MNLPSLSDLTAASLTASIAELRGKQRIDDVQFLWLLAEIDRRRSYEPLGFGSLWDYCITELHLTNGAAGRRIAAARLLAKFPAAADFLADGRLGLTTFGMLKDVLTADNHTSVFASASFKNERDVDELVRTLLPLSFSRDTVIRAACSPRSYAPQFAPTRAESTPAPGVNADAPVAGPTLTPAPGVSATDGRESEPTLKPPLVAAAATARIRAVDADYVSLTIRVPKEFMADLDQVAAALSHIVPNRKPADVLWECIRRTLAERARRKGGLPSRFTPAPGVNAAPSASGAPFTPAPGVTAGSPDSGACLTPAPGVAAAPSASGLLLTPAPGVNAAAASASVSLDSRYVPMEVARAVWEKDEGCCAFVAPDGRRCRSTHQLEIHHRLAHALGGPTSAPNLNLYCRRHNLLAAERDFGADLIDSFRRST